MAELSHTMNVITSLYHDDIAWRLIDLICLMIDAGTTVGWGLSVMLFSVTFQLEVWDG